MFYVSYYSALILSAQCHSTFPGPCWDNSLSWRVPGTRKAIQSVGSCSLYRHNKQNCYTSSTAKKIPRNLIRTCLSHTDSCIHWQHRHPSTTMVTTCIRINSGCYKKLAWDICPMRTAITEISHSLWTRNPASLPNSGTSPFLTNNFPYACC